MNALIQITLLMLVWSQPDSAQVECWNVWCFDSLTAPMRKVATVTEQRYAGPFDAPVAFYTVSASNRMGETFAQCQEQKTTAAKSTFTKLLTPRMR